MITEYKYNGVKTRKIAWLFFMLAVAFMPLMKTPVLPIFGQKLQLSDVFFVIAFLLWLPSFLKKKKSYLRCIPINFPLCMYLLIAFVSMCLLFNNVYFLNGLLEFAAVAYMVLFFYMAVDILEDKERLYKIITIIAISMTVVVVLGLFGIFSYYLGGRDSIFANYRGAIDKLFPKIVRVVSLFRNPNMLMSFFILWYPLLMLWYFNIERRSRIFKAVLFITPFFLLFTFSRGLLFFYIAVFLTLFKLPKRSVRLTQFLLIIPIFLLSLLIPVSLTWNIFHPSINISTAEKKASLDFNYRYPHYVFKRNISALGVIKDFPVKGLGIGRFPSLNMRDPHCTYLGCASEMGLPALAILLWLFAGILWTHKKVAFESEGNSDRLIGFGLLIGTGMLFVYAILIDIMSMRHLWLSMAIGTAAYLKQNKYQTRINQ